uniref:BTB domain-containing protein n=1 Tax=Romanomermis culicivorax TaxID=13658 RepID=A0A915J076_ROMCU
QNPLSQFKIADCRLSSDLGDLFESGRFADFTLILDDDRRFPVHKSILAARSPVFEAMFEHEMEEKRNNIARRFRINFHIELNCEPEKDFISVLRKLELIGTDIHIR